MTKLIRPKWSIFADIQGYLVCPCGNILKTMDEIRFHWQAGHFDYPSNRIEDEYELVDFPWGNPLSLKEYKVSHGLAQEIHNLIDTINSANKLAASCDCETCKKIREVTWLPIYG